MAVEYTITKCCEMSLFHITYYVQCMSLLLLISELIKVVSICSSFLFYSVVDEILVADIYDIYDMEKM
jgi:hypothetical protein